MNGLVINRCGCQTPVYGHYSTDCVYVCNTEIEFNWVLILYLFKNTLARVEK